MIYVLEGPDGVGKTTLADSIEAMAGLAYNVFRLRNGPPPKGVEPARYYNSLLDDMRAMPAQAVLIVDRFHVGELIYGSLLRSTSFTVDQAADIDFQLLAMGAHLIHCYLPYDTLVNRLVQRDGGVPDEKSGASLEHASTIRVQYMAYLGTPDRRGILEGWQSIRMNGYPDALARKLSMDHEYAL